MKKISLLFLVILFTQTVYSQSAVTISPKISIDLLGNHSAKILSQSGDLDVNSALTFGVEFSKKTTNTFVLGAGVSYLMDREQEIKGSGNFNFVPIYAIGRIQIGNTEDSVIPSIVGNIGYNILFTGDSSYRGKASLKGGIYFAAGLRLEFSMIFIEGLYKSFQGSATISSIEIDVNYTTLSIGAGLML